MKIFISWSGERSHKVAELLNTWVQCVLQAVNPWLSSKDIDKGSLWFSEITTQLANTHNGIVCLTKANANNPWVLFEAGALAKGLSSNRVFTLLIDLVPNDVKDPLAQFNHTSPTKSGIYQLIRTINNGLEEQALTENILSNVFETYWPQFEKEFKEILNSTPSEEVTIERPKDELLDEILYSVRGIDKRLRKIEEPGYLNPYRIQFMGGGGARLASHLRPIEDLNLSVRAFNVLKINRINTIEELMLTDLELLENCGTKSKEELKIMIEKIRNNDWS
ncbi:MAG: TIR domain-containing protein [Chitinophagaceae bacterium]|nr:TIR domain-containing protein [Chitinophagaceae bacterium]